MLWPRETTPAVSAPTRQADEEARGLSGSLGERLQFHVKSRLFGRMLRELSIIVPSKNRLQPLTTHVRFRCILAGPIARLLQFTKFSI